MTEQNKVRTIEVVPYSPKWKEEFNIEASRLRNVLKDEVVGIYHIGSTSIPRIFAKPVIDIMIEVKNICLVDNYNEYMEGLGYIPKGENGIEGRRFFIKGLYNRTHHVHVFQTGNHEIEKHLNFRDYMIAHPEAAKKYEELKKELAKKFKNDPGAYSKSKNDFIKEMDRRAKEWIKSKEL